MRPARCLSLVVFFCSSFALSGCFFGDGPPAFILEEVMVVANDEANDSAPTAVDVVFVFEAAVVERLQGMTAAAWFRGREQIGRDFPNGTFVRSWEIVPDTTLTPWVPTDDALENDDGDDAIAAFVFADLESPGDHRARLEVGDGLRITVGRDDFNLQTYESDS